MGAALLYPNLKQLLYHCILYESVAGSYAQVQVGAQHQFLQRFVCTLANSKMSKANTNKPCFSCICAHLQMARNCFEELGIGLFTSLACLYIYTYTHRSRAISENRLVWSMACSGLARFRVCCGMLLLALTYTITSTCMCSFSEFATNRPWACLLLYYGFFTFSCFNLLKIQFSVSSAHFYGVDFKYYYHIIILYHVVLYIICTLYIWIYVNA